MGCCCKKKRFLLSINKLLSHIIVLAIREVPSAIEVGISFFNSHSELMIYIFDF